MVINGGLVTPEMSRVRDGVYKTLFLFFCNYPGLLWAELRI